nr:MAG TPA: hypothetical protein [Caudoviricetes sp.]
MRNAYLKTAYDGANISVLFLYMETSPPYLSMFLAPKDNKRTTICYNRVVN